MRLALALMVLAFAMLGLASPVAAQPACNDVITEDTTLTADLDCRDTEPGPALTVGAPGITLDLGGHDVWNHGEVIHNEGNDDVTIRNGAVHGSNPPVHLIGVTGNTVRDLEVFGSSSLQKNPGIVLRDSDGNRVVSNQVDAVMIWLYDGPTATSYAGTSFTSRAAGSTSSPRTTTGSSRTSSGPSATRRSS